MDVESEEDDWNPAQYPLEGKYMDEADRAKLLALPEIQREEILAQREDEIQKWKDRIALENLVKSQKGLSGADDSSTATRKPGTRDKLDKYKAERRAKEERRQSRRDRMGSPSSTPRKSRAHADSSSEDEDGRFTKDDELNSRVSKAHDSKPEPVNIYNLETIRMGRHKLAEYCDKPWFEKMVTGTFVRIVVGEDQGKNVYRICEVLKLGEPVKPYTLEGKTARETIECRHGTAVRSFSLDRVSNTHFTDREFDRLVKTHQHDKVRFPTRQDIIRKAEELEKLKYHTLNDADIDAMLARKRELAGKNKPEHRNIAFEFARLQQALSLAQKRGDRDEVQLLKSQLLQLETDYPESVPTQAQNGVKRPASGALEEEDLAAKINKRNRLMNEENIKRTEAAEAERKRRERKLAQSKLTVEPAGLSRSATPNGHPPGSDSANVAALPVAPPSQSAASFDTVVKGIEVDLGDF
ncbi:plus-3-domain-containing protein [Exidia glandulosa HHB12029]|uniref:Plus-3-domain-containing protein n=1 Tax=Exidia glandulosa HHB12029 TaxID=1314781 RepID=A0A165K9C5_EXIGL|nr:plus-3-domain-containing protein [Exidia glandulosa HHB12029]